MKDEAEKPTGHLPTFSSPVFKPGELSEGMGDYDVLITGWFVVRPLDPPGPPGLPFEYTYS